MIFRYARLVAVGTIYNALSEFFINVVIIKPHYGAIIWLTGKGFMPSVADLDSVIANNVFSVSRSADRISTVSGYYEIHTQSNVRIWVSVARDFASKATGFVK